MRKRTLVARFEARLSALEQEITDCPPKQIARRRLLVKQADVWKEALEMCGGRRNVTNALDDVT